MSHQQGNMDLGKLVQMVKEGGIQGFYPEQIISQIGLLCVAEKNTEAEKYLRDLLEDSNGHVDLRIAAFQALIKRVVPAELASEETLVVICNFRDNPRNAKLLATLHR